MRSANPLRVTANRECLSRSRCGAPRDRRARARARRGGASGPRGPRRSSSARRQRTADRRRNAEDRRTTRAWVTLARGSSFDEIRSQDPSHTRDTSRRQVSDASFRVTKNRARLATRARPPPHPFRTITIKPPPPATARCCLVAPRQDDLAERLLADHDRAVERAAVALGRESEHRRRADAEEHAPRSCDPPPPPAGGDGASSESRTDATLFFSLRHATRQARSPDAPRANKEAATSRASRWIHSRLKKRCHCGDSREASFRTCASLDHTPVISHHGRVTVM